MRLINVFALSTALCLGAMPTAYATDPVQSIANRGESAAPSDLIEFVKDSSAAMASGKMDLIMSFYSDRYLSEGRNKTAHREWLDSWVPILSEYETVLTRYAAITDDHAYIAADIKSNLGTHKKTFDYQVIKENGQWKWLGYQR